MTDTKPVTAKTGNTRLTADLIEMMSALSWYEDGFVVAAFLDPLVRPAIEARFADLPDDVRARAQQRIDALPT